VTHPGPTVGYRIEADGGSFAYIPDHEPALGTELSKLTPDWISGFAVARDVTVLFHDAQYFEREYEDRVGWGHSSVADAVTFARLAGVEELVLFHHDPLHTDEDLLELEARARSLWDADGAPPRLAREGDVVTVAAARGDERAVS
jgi:Beta-lactamase superfamily domain